MTVQLLLWGGVLAAPVFIAVFLIEGALRPNYDPMRQAVSALAQGPRGWVQQTNFFVAGILLLACAFGLRSVLATYGSSFWAPFLIGIYALGLFGAGIFTTDAPSLADMESGNRKPRTRNGVLHDLFSTLVFGSLFAACFVFAHLFTKLGLAGWATYSVITGVLYGLGFLLFARGLSQRGKLREVAGLLQRTTIAIGAIWLALVSLHFLLA